eukprot:s1084_g9.t1
MVVLQASVLFFCRGDGPQGDTRMHWVQTQNFHGMIHGLSPCSGSSNIQEIEGIRAAEQNHGTYEVPNTHDARWARESWDIMGTWKTWRYVEFRFCFNLPA